MMAKLRTALFQRPHERINSIKHINGLIAKSKEMTDWNIGVTLEPDEIEGKVLPRPSIKNNNGPPKSLEDIQILGKVITEPREFSHWAIFCIRKDVENAKYIQDKFYELSEQQNLGVFVDYGTIMTLDNNSSINNFKEAIDEFFYDRVKESKSQGGMKGYFFLVIMPDTIR